MWSSSHTSFTSFTMFVLILPIDVSSNTCIRQAQGEGEEEEETRGGSDDDSSVECGVCQVLKNLTLGTKISDVRRFLVPIARAWCAAQS
jgi:hypothetical protein